MNTTASLTAPAAIAIAARTRYLTPTEASILVYGAPVAPSVTAPSVGHAWRETPVSGSDRNFCLVCDVHRDHHKG